MRVEASLILTGTLLASGLVLLAGSGRTLEPAPLAALGGLTGALLSVRGYVRWLAGGPRAGAQGEAIPRFWQAVAFLLLVLFWACAALTVNGAASWPGPPVREEAVVSAKWVSAGRYSDSHRALVSTPAGAIEVSMPRDVWSGVTVGQRLVVQICNGLLGHRYVVTPLDREPYLDVRRLLRLPPRDAALSC